MDKHGLITMVKEVAVERLKIDGIRRLRRFIHDPEVVDLLCREAVGKESPAVMQALIDTLKANRAEGCRRFSWLAIHADKPAARRLALIQLKSLECRQAKEAVLQGLNDPHPSVRIAAAANIPLYCDPDIAPGVERFFEYDRALLIFDLVCEAANPYLPRIDRMGEIYRDEKESEQPEPVRPGRRQMPPADRPPPPIGWRIGAGAAPKPDPETKRFTDSSEIRFPSQSPAGPPGMSRRIRP